MAYIHTTLIKDNRCLDLLLTDDEVAVFFARSLDPTNHRFIDSKNCCNCWSIEKPPKCSFWSKILGLCKECE